MFAEVFHWHEWLGNSTKSELTGVLLFVEWLLGQALELSTTHAFVRKLLVTAQQQDQLIEAREQRLKQLQLARSKDNSLINRLKQEKQDIRNCLHLPRLAYTLERLPKSVRDRSDFLPLRTSLKRPATLLSSEQSQPGLNSSPAKPDHDYNTTNHQTYL